VEVVVSAAAFSPDGKFLVLAYDLQRLPWARQVNGDRLLKLWDVNTGLEKCKFRGHTDEVTGVAFTPNGKLLLSGSASGTLRLWEASSGEPVQGWDLNLSEVSCFALSPDGKRVLTGGRQGAVGLSELLSGKRIQSFSTGQATVRWVALALDGTVAFTASQESAQDWRARHIQAWDMRTGKELPPPKGRNAWRRPLAFSPDGVLAISDDWDGDPAAKPYLVLWEVRSGKDLRKFEDRAGEVSVPPGRGDALAAAFTPDGKQVLSQDSDGILRIWDIQTGKKTRSFDLGGARIVVFSPDCRLLFTWPGFYLLGL
jgi:hypothetical protein